MVIKFEKIGTGNYTNNVKLYDGNNNLLSTLNSTGSIDSGVLKFSNYDSNNTFYGTNYVIKIGQYSK